MYLAALSDTLLIDALSKINRLEILSEIIAIPIMIYWYWRERKMCSPWTFGAVG